MKPPVKTVAKARAASKGKINEKVRASGSHKREVIGRGQAEAYANFYGPETVSSRKLRLVDGEYKTDPTRSLPKTGLFSAESRKYTKEAKAENKALGASKQSAEDAAKMRKKAGIKSTRKTKGK